MKNLNVLSTILVMCGFAQSSIAVNTDIIAPQLYAQAMDIGEAKIGVPGEKEPEKELIQDLRKGTLKISLQGPSEQPLKNVAVKVHKSFSPLVFSIDPKSDLVVISVPKDFPKSLGQPRAEIKDQNLEVAIPGWDILERPEALVEAAFVDKDGKELSAWTRFQNPLSSIVSYVRPRDMATLFDRVGKPDLSLQKWLGLLFKETVQVAGKLANYRLQVSFVMPLKDGLTTSIPLLLVPVKEYTAQDAAKISEGILGALRQLGLSKTDGDIVFDIKVIKNNTNFGIQSLELDNDDVVLTP
ncbi:MAG: hypothetical protein HUU57_05475 [Bdellovibrio sp.]|nr:hypothetical protein [Bdellovibrio sp.]